MEPDDVPMAAPEEEEAGTRFFSMPSPAPAGRPTAGSNAAPSDSAGALARRQLADGSFGGDVVETLVALLILLRAGHTRRSGLRRRVVQKAARWLSGQPPDPRIADALALLVRTEAGQAPSDAELRAVADLLGTAGERVFAAS